MDANTDSNTNASAARPGRPSEVHNASVNEAAARQGGCAQVHLPTGEMCTLRRGHDGSCEFSPAGQADALLARHKAAENW